MRALNRRATTNLHINVTDVNDNAPEFIQSSYSATIEEEDERVPRELLRVSATDRDSGDSRVVYRLEGQGAGKYFQVDNLTGIVHLVSKVDRDAPYGAPMWKFIVQASSWASSHRQRRGF